MAFSRRTGFCAVLACWAVLSCAQAETAAIESTEPELEFEWERADQFPKYCIWRELAPVDGAACWELIIFNHTRETLVVPLAAEQPIFVMHELLPWSEMIQRKQSEREEAERAIPGRLGSKLTQLSIDAYLVPPDYAQRFRVLFPISSTWSYAEFQFGGAESGRLFPLDGPVIAPGQAAAAAVRVEVDSASWKRGEPDFLMSLDRLDQAWSDGETWAIEYPTPRGWYPATQADKELPLRPSASGFRVAGSVAKAERFPVALHWTLRCFPVRATARIAERNGTVRSRAIYLPRYPCHSLSCQLCRHERP